MNYIQYGILPARDVRAHNEKIMLSTTTIKRAVEYITAYILSDAQSKILAADMKIVNSEYHSTIKTIRAKLYDSTESSHTYVYASELECTFEDSDYSCPRYKVNELLMFEGKIIFQTLMKMALAELGYDVVIRINDPNVVVWVEWPNPSYERKPHDAN